MNTTHTEDDTMPRPRNISQQSIAVIIAAACLLTIANTRGFAGELHIGGATTSITPNQPVALLGQMHTRIAKQVESPVTATALALESRDGEKVLDQAIMVSCDLVAIREGILEMVRDRLKEKLPDFDVNKLFLSATHTHTAPVMREDAYQLPEEGIVQPAVRPLPITWWRR